MNILLIDDHALFRGGFKLMLERVCPQPLHIVEVGSVESGLMAVQAQAFNIVFLDLGLPGLCGMEGLRAMCNTSPDTSVVVLSAIEDGATMRLALDNGANGYIPKTASADDISHAMTQILSGQIYAPMLDMEPQDAGPRLTGRQMEVLTELCAGCTNKQIADRLGLSDNTVRVHTTTIFRVLGVRSRTEAVLLAKRKGWC